MVSAGAEHPWRAIALWPGQLEALREVERLLASGASTLPICLMGDFGSGKTTLARYWLAGHFAAPEECYCSLNRPLLDALKEAGDLDDLAATPEKTALLLRMALDEIIARRFEGRDALVFDSVEVLQPYRLPLMEMFRPYTQRGKVALVCVPDSPERGFRFSVSSLACHIVRLHAE
jgi:hypothetical protein